MSRSEAVELVATVTADVDDAVRDFGNLGDAAEEAGEEANRAARLFDGASEATDNLDTKASAATGALGALSSGFDLVGMGAVSDALNNTALATDFLSGVGASATLILESEQVAMLKTAAATVKNGAAAAFAATKTAVMTAAQWALNVAMEANPIGLILIGLAALIALMVLLYKKVPAVRNVIDAMWGALKAGAAAIPAAIKVAVGAITDAGDTIAGVWSDIVDGLKAIPHQVGVWFGKIADAATGALDGLGDAIASIFKDALQGVVDLINKLIRAFNKLPGPNISEIPSVSASASANRAALATVSGVSARGSWVPLAAPAGTASTGGGDITIVIQGAVDPESTARQVQSLLAGSAIRHGSISVTNRTLRTLRPSG